MSGHYARQVQRVFNKRTSNAKIGIIGFQEIRWKGMDETMVSDYTDLWSGPEDNSSHQAD